jgi:hypothetical protein
MALALAAVALAGTVMGTQYVSAWHHGHYGHHGGYASAMASGGGTSAGKMHLDEGIKVLKTGDIKGALMHLHISDKILSGITSSSAQTGRMHLDEGIKVLKTGDIKGALMHLHISDKILGGGGYSSGGGGGYSSGGGGGY